MYIGNLNKQIWAQIIYIGAGPKVLSLDRPTIYNHAGGYFLGDLQKINSYFYIVLKFFPLKMSSYSFFALKVLSNKSD